MRNVVTIIERESRQRNRDEYVDVRIRNYIKTEGVVRLVSYAKLVLAHAQYSSGWHMRTAKPVTQIEATINDSVSERRLVPASRTHTARDNIYSDPHAL